MNRITRMLGSGLVAGALLAAPAAPAAAQVGGLPDLPIAPDGALGAILQPIEDLLDPITDALGDVLGDLPLDNAVTLTAEDAVDAAIAMSRITFDSSQYAFVGRDDVFADTLSSVAGQGIAGAPLLLTATDTLDERTVEELTRLGVTDVIILGSDAAISPDVEADLAERYGTAHVARVGGPSRIETAADLAAEVAPAADTVVLMRAYPNAGSDQSQAYADALSAGPFASINEYPSLLTTTDYLHAATEAYLDSADVQEVIIVGGEAAVGAEVEQALVDKGIAVDRIAGATRWATAIQVARAMGMNSAADANRLVLTEGGAVEEPLWAAGFTAAAHGAVYQSPVILADGPLLPPETISFIGDGLIANALRLSNEPLICNSFVDFLACEVASLLMLGQLDAVDELLGGTLNDILGETVLEELAAALEQIIPQAGDMSPGLVGQILSLIGVPGTDEAPDADECTDGIDNDADGEIDNAEECADDDADADDEPTTRAANPEQQYEAAMADQPDHVADAFYGLTGREGDRASMSVQQLLTVALHDLQVALGGPVDTTDPAQAELLVALLAAIDEAFGSRTGTVPLAEFTDLLNATDALSSAVDVEALAELINGVGVDVDDAAAGLVDTLTDTLSGVTTPDALVDTYGEDANPLADAVSRLLG